MSDLGSPAQQNPTPAPVPSSASRSQAPVPTSRGQSSDAPSPLPAKAVKSASPSGVNVVSAATPESPDNPAPLTGTVPIAPATQPEVSLQPAPIQDAKATVAPAPVALAKPPVAPAPLATNKIAPPALQHGVIVALAPTAVKPSAPMAPAAFKPEAVVAPAPLAKVPPDPIAPVSQWQNLLCFEDLDTIISAITKAKDRAKQSQERLEKLLIQNRETDDDPAGEEKLKLILKYQPGPQFAWSRVGDEPPIPLNSCDALVEAVFGDSDQNFSAEALLTEAIGKLPAEIAESVRDQKASTLNLEGLWIEFSSTEPPKLEITVSIASSSTTNNLGPFSLHRIYLKFGDSQRDLPARQKNSSAET